MKLLLLRIKKIHDFYSMGDNIQKGRIFDASQPFIGKLVLLGFDRAFVESLVLFGKEFLIAEGVDDEIYSTFFT